MKHRKNITDEELIKLLNEAKPSFIVPRAVDEKTRKLIRANTVKNAVPKKKSGKVLVLRVSTAIAASIIVCISLFLVVNHIRTRDISTGVFKVESVGDFSIIRHGETVLKNAKAGIVSGDILKTGTDGRCRLRLNSAEIVLTPETSLSIENLDNNNKTVFISFIKSGTIAVHSKKLGKDSSIIVRTRNAVVSVKGTRFCVTANSATGTRVSVSEGKVLLEGKKLEAVTIEKNNTADVRIDNRLNVRYDPVASEKVNSILRLRTVPEGIKTIADQELEHGDDTTDLDGFKYLGSVTVKGSDVWKKSGISVKSGDTIRIIAFGKVRIDPTSQIDISPDGYPNLKTWQDSSYSNASLGTLLLRVDYQVYNAGSDKIINIDRTGEITLMANDGENNSSDNIGSFDVKIYIKEDEKKSHNSINLDKEQLY
jgi:hypothetical protein